MGVVDAGVGSGSSIWLRDEQGRKEQEIEPVCQQATGFSGVDCDVEKARGLDAHDERITAVGGGDKKSWKTLRPVY